MVINEIGSIVQKWICISFDQIFVFSLESSLLVFNVFFPFNQVILASDGLQNRGLDGGMVSIEWNSINIWPVNLAALKYSVGCNGFFYKTKGITVKFPTLSCLKR